MVNVLKFVFHLGDQQSSVTSCHMSGLDEVIFDIHARYPRLTEMDDIDNECD